MGHLPSTPPNKHHMASDLVGFALWGFECQAAHQVTRFKKREMANRCTCTRLVVPPTIGESR